jgi:hypothetical protein
MERETSDLFFDQSGEYDRKRFAETVYKVWVVVVVVVVVGVIVVGGFFFYNFKKQEVNFLSVMSFLIEFSRW